MQKQKVTLTEIVKKYIKLNKNIYSFKQKYKFNQTNAKKGIQKLHSTGNISLTLKTSRDDKQIIC